MDSTKDEEDSRIDYDCFIVDRESPNLTSRRQLRTPKGNTYKESISAVKKREQKMFEPGETLPLVKNEEGKKQNSQKSTSYSIIYGLLMLSILLTSALAVLFHLRYLEVKELLDGKLNCPCKTRNTREVDTQKESMLNEEIRKLKSNASDLSHEIRKLRDETQALQRTIDDQKKKMELQAADISKLTNNATILMDTISSQKKTISEKEAVIASRGVDINRLKNKINELSPEHTSVMLLGGWHNYLTNSTTIYNSMEKGWKTCNLTLPHVLANHGAVVLNNEIYILGGYANGVGGNPFASVYKMGVDNEWKEMAPMIEKRGSIPQSSLVFNSEIWVIGGLNGTNALKSVEKYNPKTNRWTKMPELNEPGAMAAAVVINGKIYFTGGPDKSRTKNSVEVYDPEKQKWEIFTYVPDAIHSHILIGNHSDLIIIGNDLSTQTYRGWKMDVLDTKRQWEEMPSLQQKRGTTGAAQIADGLMVFGGATSLTQRIDSVEIFDGIKWNKGPKLPEIRGVFAYFPLTCAQERLFLKRYCP